MVHRRKPQTNILKYNNLCITNLNLLQDNSTEENVKIVEVDTSMSKARHSYSTTGSHPERPLSSQGRCGVHHPKVSPAPSALTDMSPRTYSGRFDEFSFTTARSGGCSPAVGSYFKSESCASDATKSPYGK